MGFITYGVKNGTASAYKAMEDKTAGVIRSVISSVTHPGQTLVLKALQDPAFRQQQRAKVEILRKRFEVTGQECYKTEYQDCWDVYPHNSGYFMCLRLKGVDADTVRVKLLDEYGVGTICPWGRKTCALPLLPDGRTDSGCSRPLPKPFGG